ncbi:putative Histidine decarboxylase [Vibrio nigripulchritudo SO65]|uniref:pyridoxal-dependent decarboxylase n=1 Tax=Vibrio nigripulchritudo TaxID=28173 RepID=UPI0003B197F3|nr:pyridoxal-dependent decarboxylase [Vibrio nigripulchritudo]CCN35349.1 putative Histidine decarboxylase [Vibrio nigripulchritudo AM115]CCN42662.1 putative Histidine decarboxylase [Vibrio nigripulchritudo FTn2]CCN63121.1 putative Histidine decarboxylase [Vibrio nigripulchritudo POn4]CCN77326.1 putative Histidine decarboxylase [Vibrio nigripulchritudo SO65]
MSISDCLSITELGLPQPDKDTVLREYLEEMQLRKQHFLGYQTNQNVVFSPELSPFLSLNLLNLGDGYEDGSYQINAKQFERAVLNYYARLWGMTAPNSKRNYWGYVTSMGSTEGNLYALWNARDYLSGSEVEGYEKAVEVPNPPVLISSESTHYSVYKACQMLGIPTFNQAGEKLGQCPINEGDWKKKLEVDEYGSVIEEDLFRLTEFFLQHQHPVILFLNHGTTFSGGSDAIFRILTKLKPLLGKNTESNRRYWVHVDGALSANFSPFLQPNPFTVSDHPYEFRHPEVMSVCASPYKWLGAPWSCGVYLMQKRYKVGSSSRPTYIAGRDSTIAGSRQGLYSLYLWERLSSLGTVGLKQLAEQNESNTAFLQQALLDLSKSKRNTHRQSLIVMPRMPGANMVRFSSPRSHITAKYSLAEENIPVDGKLQRFCHVVLLSHIQRPLLDQFLAELSDPYAFSGRALLPRNPLSHPDFVPHLLSKENQ